MTNPTNIGLAKLKKYISQDNIKCLDIGANTGQFYRSLIEIYPECYCHLIEVNPTCERFISPLKVPYEMIGLSNKEGYMELITTVRKPRSKGASFYMESSWKELSEEEMLKIKVPVTTLDSHFINTDWDLVKIDVQGSELDIINGGKKFLSKINFLLIEVSLVEYNIGAPHAKKVIESLEKLGFYVLDCIDKHIGTKGETIQLDLLFTKELDSHNLESIKDYNLL